MADKLFAEFPPVSTQKWEEVINADLKGADYEKKLVWKTLEGFNVRPYYRAENLASIDFLGSQPGQYPYVRGVKANNNWLVRQSIVVDSPKDANAKALEILMKGVDSLRFVIKTRDFSEADLETLLKGIELKAVDMEFSGSGAKTVAILLLDKVKKEGREVEEVKVSFNIDPIIKKLSIKGILGCCDDGSHCMKKMAGLIKSSAPYKRMRFIGVNGNIFHNSGSTIVEELAFSLAVGHEYVAGLMAEGLTIDEAAPTIKFTMAVSSNYFMEIAKFRAARLLWANIAKPYNPSRGCSSKMRVNAVTSSWNMTIYDPYVNMLRGTTEAMSAAIGGVDSIEVLPFDKAFQTPTDFSSRIARNTQLLLKEESHFNQVADASGGSYYIETLTKSIAEQAWKLFVEIENMGGYMAAFKAGFIQGKIEESAAKKDKNIATRREILLGTNQYPNFMEKVKGGTDAKAKAKAKDENFSCYCVPGEWDKAQIRGLKPYRGAMAFEELRRAVDNSVRAPKAFMLTVGSLSFARARAQFSSNFFGCAGIEPIDNIRFNSVEEGVQAALAAKADIVVLCSSDEEYAQFAPEASKALGGKAILVVAGDPACKAELEEKGITNFISVKSNVLETLRGYVKQLDIK